MSVVVRFVAKNKNNEYSGVRERFLEFLRVKNQTIWIKELEELKIYLSNDMWKPGYDNRKEYERRICRRLELH